MTSLPVVDGPSRSCEGLIAGCAHAGCGRRCCDFSAGNYIVLYPGELNEASKRGEALDHLELRPSGEGGHRAICHAEDTARCDGGYKPLDCASYPFFPGIDRAGRVQVGHVGSKCPLDEPKLDEHRGWVETKWSLLAQPSLEIRRWITRVRLVGYGRTESSRESEVAFPRTPGKALPLLQDACCRQNG